MKATNRAAVIAMFARETDFRPLRLDLHAGSAMDATGQATLEEDVNELA